MYILCNIVNSMLKYSWSEEKNKLLKETRGIGFEEIALALQEGQSLASIPHPNKKKYHSQRIFIVVIRNYTYAVPYIKQNQRVLLKTIYPSRKYHKAYYKEKI